MGSSERPSSGADRQKSPVLTRGWAANGSTPRGAGRLARGLWLSVGLVLLGCGAGPSQQEVERSMREFQLADQLAKEGNLAAAVEHLRKSLELDPRNGRAHVVLGYIKLNRGDADGAVEHLRKGVQYLAEEPAVGAPRALAEARSILGVALVQRGDYDEAIEVLRASATDLANTSPHTAWGNLGMAYYEKGEYAQAMEAFSQAVKMQPRFCQGYYNMARVHVAGERLEQAEQALTRALEADEECAERYQAAYRLRGEVRARLGNREDAVHDLERCIAIAPKSEDARACRRLLGAD